MGRCYRLKLRLQSMKDCCERRSKRLFSASVNFETVNFILVAMMIVEIRSFAFGDITDLLFGFFVEYENFNSFFALKKNRNEFYAVVAINALVRLILPIDAAENCLATTAAVFESDTGNFYTNNDKGFVLAVVGNRMAKHVLFGTHK